MRNNKALPLKALTLLGNSADSVGWRVDRLIYELKELGGFNKTLRTLYEAIEIVNQIKDGDISYPGPTSTELGMKVEFKCVCRLLLCRHMRLHDVSYHSSGPFRSRIRKRRVQRCKPCPSLFKRVNFA